MQVVSDIADHSGASMMAAGRKFCDVASQPCALVWSSQRVIRWFHPSPSFVNFIEPGASLGFDSLALAAHEGRTLTDQMEEVPAEAWIKSSWIKEDAVVSEQSIFMPSYEGCLSLIWIRRATRVSHHGQEILSTHRSDTLTQTFFIHQLFPCSQTADHTFTGITKITSAKLCASY
jgi:hypothetical protein